jgi:hypothetical protein
MPRTPCGLFPSGKVEKIGNYCQMYYMYFSKFCVTSVFRQETAK